MSSNSNHKDDIQSITTVVAIAFIHIFVVKTLRKKKIEQTFKRHTHASRSTGTNSGDEEKKEDPPPPGDLPLSVVVTLPEWTTEFYNERKNNIYTDDKEMMRVAMELSKVNIVNETGGPFGTAIFEYNPNTNESKLFSLGVNRVVPLCNSTLHGEMTAIQFGQQRINNFSFASAGSAQGNKQYHLYTSAAPCCQCLGGIMWSGVSKLVCGATKDDVESIGFHEGPVFDPMSYDALEDAGCTVVREVLREECAEVLQYYKEHGEIYNP